MFIRNGQDFSNLKSHNISDVSDISELNQDSKNSKILKEEKIVYKNKAGKKANKIRVNRFTEYISGRKYYILVLSFIYTVGLLIGAVLVKNIDEREAFELCSAIDRYFLNVPSMNMTARIFSNIALNLVFLFGIYICGITVFSHFICSAFCLYKGLTIGFIIGVYIIGGSTLFHLGICGIIFVLYLFVMMFFILACSESMSFSSFLFKSEENFKSNLSFKNVSVYSSRNLLILILISLMSVVQTIVPPVVYAVFE